MSKKQHIHIMLDSDLWREAKAQAVLDSKTVAEWMTEAIQAKLNKENKRK